MRRSRRQQRGAALVAVLAFSVLVLALLSTALQLASTRVRRSSQLGKSTRAYYAAESGIRLAAQQANARLGTDFDFNIADFEGPKEAGFNAPLSLVDGGPDVDGDGFVDIAAGLSFHAQRHQFSTESDSSGRRDGRVTVRARGDSFNLHVRAVASFDGHSRVVEAILKPTLVSVFGTNKGLFAGNSLSSEGSIFADSYDSSVGSYASQSSLKDVVIPLGLDANGDGVEDSMVALDDNGNPIQTEYANARIETGGNNTSTIQGSSGELVGQLIVGPDGTATLPDSSFTPTKTLSEPVPDPVIVGTEVPSSSSNSELPQKNLVSSPDGAESFSMNGSKSALELGAAGSASTYVFSEFSQNGGTITIKGEVTLFVKNSFEMAGQSSITVPEGSSLTIISEGSVRIAGGGVANQSSSPSNFQIRASSTESSSGIDSGGKKYDIVIEGSAAFSGVIVAPESDLRIAGNSEFFGGAQAKNITTAGGTRFHFDESLAKGFEGAKTPVDYKLVAINERR